jgi:hypothetical protein
LLLNGPEVGQDRQKLCLCGTRPPENVFRDIDRVPVIVDKAFEAQEPLELELQGQLGLF